VLHAIGIRKAIQNGRLDLVEREALEIAQRGVPGAEIVQRNPQRSPLASNLKYHLDITIT